MVYTFTCSDPRYEIYMGRDKFENEELIAHGWPEDVWFHVDKLSSAHVYLRMPLPERPLPDDKQDPDLKSIPQKVLDEVAQLTKANSIEGCKQPHVDIVYTPWSNLRKSAHMDIGQVGFKDEKRVRYIKNVARDRELLKALEKVSRRRTERAKNREEAGEPRLLARSLVFPTECRGQERGQGEREEIFEQRELRKCHGALLWKTSPNIQGTFTRSELLRGSHCSFTGGSRHSKRKCSFLHLCSVAQNGRLGVSSSMQSDCARLKNLRFSLDSQIVVSLLEAL